MNPKTNMQNTTKKAFSLIELLLVIGIIAVMTGVVLLSMKTNKRSNAVEVAARQLAATLRQMQNNAITGVQYNDGSGQKTCGYGIEYGVLNGAIRSDFKTKYYRAATCPDIGSVNVGNLQDLGNASRLKASPSSNATSEKIIFNNNAPLVVYFAGPHGTPFSGDSTAISQLNADLVITIKNNSASDVAQINVCITPSGIIKEGAVGAAGC